MTVVSLQYLTPLILTLNCTLLLKTLGENQPGRERGGAEPGDGVWSCSRAGLRVDAETLIVQTLLSDPPSRHGAVHS